MSANDTMRTAARWHDLNEYMCLLRCAAGKPRLDQQVAFA